ncbi:MAG: hypothetical protein ACQGVK_00435 [Myxococcota bacterium]
MSPKHACEHSTLARHGNGHISICEHGTVHVSLGSISLRLSEAQFQGVARLFARASDALPHGLEEARPTYLC